MTEIREIKNIEKAFVKFVANDGKEFLAKDDTTEAINEARNLCAAHDRMADIEAVKEAFERLDYTHIKSDIVQFFYGDDARILKVNLESKKDYYALIDFLKVVEFGGNWDTIEVLEPKSYPETKYIGMGYEWAYEFRDFEKRVKDTLADTKKIPTFKPKTEDESKTESK